MMDKIIETVCREIDAIRREKGFVLVSVDGRCGSGKTTMAMRLQEIYQCEVIHMDHFFPRLEQRTVERLSEPGGNVDRERFLEEVIAPLKRREAFSYRRYDAHAHKMAETIEIGLNDVFIIEGSYSCHPALFDYYDLRVFLTVSESERLRRIKQRNGEEGLIMFREKWIPMEEHYFSAYGIEHLCNLHFATG